GLRLYRLPVIRSGDSLTFILNKKHGRLLFSFPGRDGHTITSSIITALTVTPSDKIMPLSSLP
ncbi:hypothetical protein ACSLPG_30920, partial [Escherichia coli]